MTSVIDGYSCDSVDRNAQLVGGASLEHPPRFDVILNHCVGRFPIVDVFESGDDLVFDLFRNIRGDLGVVADKLTEPSSSVVRQCSRIKFVDVVSHGDVSVIV